MTNIAFISVAYKMVALQLMIGEANFFAERLNLPTPRPIQITNLTQTYVSPPGLGFGGVVATTNFTFAFYKEGALWKVYNTSRQYGNWTAEWSKPPSVIDKKEAYQLATQWLSAVSLDVVSLNKKFKAKVIQPFYYNPPSSDNKEDLPVYEVKWGDDANPAVNVTILGPTKELMLLEIKDLSFSKRPSLVIPNAEQLNRRPYPVVKKLVNAATNDSGWLIPLRSPGKRQPPTNRTIKNNPTVSSNVLSPIHELPLNKTVP